MVSIVEYTKSIPYELGTDTGKRGTASVSVLQYGKIMILKIVSPLHRKYLFTNNKKRTACHTVTHTARPFAESLETPLFFFSPFTLKSSSSSDICYAYDNNEGDFQEKEYVLFTLNRELPLGYFCIVMWWWFVDHKALKIIFSTDVGEIYIILQGANASAYWYWHFITAKESQAQIQWTVKFHFQTGWSLCSSLI